MNTADHLLATLVPMDHSTEISHSAVQPADLFTTPARGFTGAQPAEDWQHGLLTGNGTLGALVPGNPYDETLYFSHAGLYLPNPNSDCYIEMASRLDEIRKLCLAGDYVAAGEQIKAARKEYSYRDERDPFIAAFTLHVRHPESKVIRYQRAVDFLTAETHVCVEDEKGSFRRSAFASRPDDSIVLRLARSGKSGSGKQTAEFFFAALPPGNDKEKKIIEKGVKSSEQGVRDGFLYFRTFFARTNPYNPNIGYEGFGKVIATGGQREETERGIHITEADEVLVLVKIQPLLKKDNAETNFETARQALDAVTPDYATLLARQEKVQSDLMSRVRLLLDAPTEDRVQPTEQLIEGARALDAPLAKIERTFDAGRYNIICATGLHPPNLQGLWSGTWSAPWSGSFTTNGNLQCAIAFLLMGNTPELMHAYFRYHDERWQGFRENAQVFYGMRGFHIPAQITISPRETDSIPKYPHCYWHAGAAWALRFYYDYYRYSGDRKFLEERAYPLMKEAAEFYEDFLTITDENGKVVFVPSYSPENAPGKESNCPTAINATMDVAAAKQLLRNAIGAAKLLDRDADLQVKWAEIIARLPAYEVGPDGSFREWLWPGLEENNNHRHASHFYELYDEMPADILNNPALVKAVEHSVRARLRFQKRVPIMAFGVVQLGLAAAHIGHDELTQEIINFLAKNYWSAGMASFHNRHNLFNLDISGGFPYLCASALVYGDPGYVRFFPARPPQWQRGSLQGVRLRGGIVVRELTWDGPQARAVLVSDTDQTVTVEATGGTTQQHDLRAGVEIKLEFLCP